MTVLSASQLSPCQFLENAFCPDRFIAEHFHINNACLSARHGCYAASHKLLISCATKQTVISNWWLFVLEHFWNTIAFHNSQGKNVMTDVSPGCALLPSSAGKCYTIINVMLIASLLWRALQCCAHCWADFITCSIQEHQLALQP